MALRLLGDSVIESRNGLGIASRSHSYLEVHLRIRSVVEALMLERDRLKDKIKRKGRTRHPNGRRKLKKGDVGLDLLSAVRAFSFQGLQDVVHPDEEQRHIADKQ